MKNIIPSLFLILLTLSLKAQDQKIQVAAKPSEQKEIAADKQLRKTIQQKQLSAAPERIADKPLNAGKDEKNKTTKCCKKKTAKT